MIEEIIKVEGIEYKKEVQKLLLNWDKNKEITRRLCKKYKSHQHVVISFSKHIRVLKANHFVDSNRVKINGQRWYLKIISKIPQHLIGKFKTEIKTYIENKLGDDA